MKSNAAFTIAALITAASVTSTFVWAADVPGPYNNRHTCIEYTLAGANTWLYALNAADMPQRTEVGSAYKKFNREVNGSGSWGQWNFQDEIGGSPYSWGSFPSMLSRNNAPALGGDFFVMSAAEQENGQIALTKQIDGGGEFWVNRDPNPNNGTRVSRLVVHRTNPLIQWAGCNWIAHSNDQDKLEKTTTGWTTEPVHQTALEGLPDASAIYSLAIDDRATVTQAVAIVSQEGIYDHDSHIGYVLADGLYYYESSAGNDWTPANPPDWPADVYNVQVAMISANANPPHNIHKVYVVGCVPATPSVYCAWADLSASPDGEFTWHSSAVEEINPGSGVMPTYPFDLVVERNGDSFTLLLATSENMYYASHNGTDDNIPWEPRMGTGDNMIRAKGFRDIAIHPNARATHFAVAGEVCSYSTEDAGINWSPIYNSTANNPLILYPSTGAKQTFGMSTESPIVTLHAPMVFSPLAATTPVFVERAYYEGGPDGFGETVQIGYVWGGSPVKLLVSGGTYIGFWSDPLATHEGGNTVGFAYRSTDLGRTWSPCTWLNELFPLDQASAPDPSHVIASPEGNFLAITFSNPSANVPAFAFSVDDGATWQRLDGLSEGGPVSVGTSGTTRKVYVASGNNLWVSLNNGPWTAVPEPIGGLGDIHSLASTRYAPDHIGLIDDPHTGVRYFRVSTNGGATWTSYPIAANLFPNALIADYDRTNTFFASFFDGNTIQNVLEWTRNGGSSWMTVDSWSQENGRGGPSSTDLWMGSYFVEQGGYTMRRVIWTGTHGSGIDLPITPNPNSGVRYYDFRFIPDPRRWERDFVTMEYVPGLPTIVPEASSVPLGKTLKVDPGVEVLVGSSSDLKVEGTLLVGSNSGSTVSIRSLEAGTQWGTLYIQNAATLENCTVEDAEIGIETHKASNMSLSSCTITNCGTGLVAYQPSGTGEPSLANCQINGNESDGASFLAVANSMIDQCEFSGNGGDGLVMTNSYAKIVSSEFAGNGNGEGGYGLVCFGSSPLLTCNNFESNSKGEMALYNQSYPVLESASGVGMNSFFNNSQNLIEMWDSYPLTEDGHNNFTVGSTGYFMADMSTSPPTRNISGNFWNPSLTLAALYPSNSSVYKWTSTDPTAISCGSAAGASSNATQQMFSSAMTAQANGDYVASSALFGDLIEQYPDSMWAAPSVAQWFANQCMIGEGFEAAQDELLVTAQEHAESSLGAVAEAYATRLYVENEEFAPAVDTYTMNLVEAASATDSLFAEVDLAITSFRADGGGGSLDQMNVAEIQEVFRRMGALAGHTPSSPTASHSGYVAIPKTVSLEVNFPNPFNAETTIRFYLPEATRAEIVVYNIVGQKVVTLRDEFMAAGFHNLKWAAGDFASGVYLYQLKAGGAVETRKMVLIK